MAQRYIIICHKMLLKKIFFLMDYIFLVFNICAFLPLRLCDFARNNNLSQRRKDAKFARVKVYICLLLTLLFFDYFCGEFNMK